MKYHVLKGNKTVAFATTKREAEAEARRIGGRVVVMGPKPNPYQGELDVRTPTRYVTPAKNVVPEGALRDFDPANQGYEYAFTILSPKSMVPVAIYVNESDSHEDYEGWAPDLSRVYGEAYLDTSETNESECSRQHMSPGLKNRLDAGTGVGPAMYMAGPIVETIKKRRKYSSYCTFSPSDTAGDRYTSRTSDASRAWRNLVDAGVARTTTESVDDTNDWRITEEMLENEYNLSNIQDIEPNHVTVYSSTEVEVQEMELDSVLKERILLHTTDALRSTLETKGSEEEWSPPASAFAEINFTHCTMQDVMRYIDFCSEDMGDMLADRLPYKKEALSALITNPNKPKGYVDPRQLNLPLGAQLDLPIENPRRKNPADSAWTKHITSDKWGDE